MREIKFRAWKTNRTPTMLYSGQFDIEYSHPKKRYKAVDHTRFDGQWDMPLMQFTGLKDKNGKEIYEGDIVRVDYDGEEKTIHTVFYGIEYDYPAFDLEPDLDCDCNSLQHCICSGSTTIEVIGNIYENPELLK